jgi:hypothetical protein
MLRYQPPVFILRKKDSMIKNKEEHTWVVKRTPSSMLIEAKPLPVAQREKSRRERKGGRCCIQAMLG